MGGGGHKSTAGCAVVSEKLINQEKWVPCSSGRKTNPVLRSNMDFSLAQNKIK